ncbi:MAG TPA: YcxB family protein [Parvularculaceae bacterium]|nr:YcxB family protein [Parvularculaceae bacterium]
MLIRADIDKQDILNVERDTRRWLTGGAVSLGVMVLLLSLLLVGAGLAAYFSAEPVLKSVAQGGGAGFLRLLQNDQSSIMRLLASLALFITVAAAGYAVYRARRKLGAVRSRQKMKNGLTVGRFEYAFTDKHLIIKGPLETKRIAWTFFTHMEDAKSSIVFWREDGGREFIPKNVLPENVNFDKLRGAFQPRIDEALGFDEALHAAQLTITYELLNADKCEYLDHYFERIEGKLSFIRRLFAWTPAPAFLFLALSLIAAYAFYDALKAGDLVLVAIGAASLSLAAGLIAVKSAYFLGAARALFKKSPWPFAQSTLTSVSLTNEAVFWRERGVQRIIQWDAIEELIECPLTAYLVATPDMVIALPKRAFISAKHYHPFIGYANSRIASAIRARAERKEQRLARSIGKQKAAPPAGKRPAATITNIKAAAAARRKAPVVPRAKAG